MGQTGIQRPWTVLIVDDHKVVIDALSMLIGDSGRFEVIGTATSPERALELVGKLNPDALILDLQLDGRLDAGIAVAKQVRSRLPQTHILVLTAHGRRDVAAQLVELGVAGYLLKTSPLESVVSALELIKHGVRVFDQGIGETPGAIELTSREGEMLKLLAQGHSNLEIAQRLNVSESTVRNTLTNVYAKLEVSTRSQAIVRAIQLGLVNLDPV